MLNVVKWLPNLLLLLFFGNVNACVKEIRLASIDYPPYYGKSLKNYGPIIELITQAYKNTGYNVKIIFLPWARAISWSKSGEVDGIVGVWYSTQRATYLHHSMPIYPNTVVFYKRKNTDISYKNFSDLKRQGYTLGSVRGYVHPVGLEESGIKILYVNDDYQSFKLLSKGRVSLIVADKDYAHYMLAQPALREYAQNIQWMAPVLEMRHQHLGISKVTNNAQKKLTDFNRGLQMLKQNGEFAVILKKHKLAPSTHQ
ncbi:MAG: transporter substrate-binding domain-containing protein [Algicola sp.]|nr:transporter substrate-binding domain-containing protein [Algicola sp.]